MKVKVVLHIRKIRMERGISLERLAQQLDITEWTLARWERGEGKLTLNMVLRIACVLEVSPYQLFHFPSSLGARKVHNNRHSTNSLKQLQRMMDRLENQLETSLAENSKLRSIVIKWLKGDP